MNPRPEAYQAALWWARQLNHAVHDMGSRTAEEREGSAWANLVARTRKPFTEEQVVAFGQHLAVTIEEHLAGCERYPNEGSWRPGEPRWGSAIRCIHVDYGPDPVLQDAARRAGFALDMLDMPIKTVMWINPGIVTVRSGYGGDIKTVWERQ